MVSSFQVQDLDSSQQEYGAGSELLKPWIHETDFTHSNIRDKFTSQDGSSWVRCWEECGYGLYFTNIAGAGPYLHLEQGGLPKTDPGPQHWWFISFTLKWDFSNIYKLRSPCSKEFFAAVVAGSILVNSAQGTTVFKLKF